MTDARIGDTVRVRLPWSEVCMYMGVQDREMSVRVEPFGAVLLNDDGTQFCPAITHGEAGIKVIDAEKA